MNNCPLIFACTMLCNYLVEITFKLHSHYN